MLLTCLGLVVSVAMALENCLRWGTTASFRFDLFHMRMLIVSIAFNAFGCNYNEGNLIAMAHSMVEEGLVEAGYNSIIFDDCFTKKERGDAGELLEGTVLFSLVPS